MTVQQFNKDTLFITNQITNILQADLRRSAWNLTFLISFNTQNEILKNLLIEREIEIPNKLATRLNWFNKLEKELALALA